MLELGVGPERAVPATKTVTGQMLAVAAVAAALGRVPFEPHELDAMPDAVASVLDDAEPAHRLAARWAHSARLFVAARGLMYAAALEAALKIKEITGILAEGISVADLRHGPIGVARDNVPVLALDGGGAAREDVREVAELARERGAPVAVCGDVSDSELPLPGGRPEALAVFPATVRAQQCSRSPWRMRAASTPMRRPGSRRSHQRSERRRNEEQVQAGPRSQPLSVAALFALGLAACGG